MEAYVGSIMLWPLNWAPDGWAFCQGQTLSITENQALYSLLGTVYGGNGTTTFGLPDLRGRVPLGTGPSTAAPGTNFILAGQGGATTNNVSGPFNATVPAQQVTLTAAQVPLPAHTHSTPANNFNVSIPANSTTVGNTSTPGPTAVISKGVAVNGIANYPANIYNTVAANTNLAPIPVTIPAGTTGVSAATTASPVTIPAQNIGGNAGFTTNSMQPYITLNFIICLVGYYPPRP